MVARLRVSSGNDWQGGNEQADPVTREKQASAKCRECGKDMNPVDAMVGGAGDGKEPVCQSCAKNSMNPKKGSAQFN